VSRRRHGRSGIITLINIMAVVRTD